MFLVNGSVETKGSDNYLPIDNTYDFPRYATRLVLQANDTNEITDLSPYKNIVKINNVTIDKSDNKSFSFNKELNSSLIVDCNNIITLNQIFTIGFRINTLLYAKQNNNYIFPFVIGDTVGLTHYLGFSFGCPPKGESEYLCLTGSLNNGAFNTIIENKTIKVSDGKWHTIHLTRDGNNTLRYFIDGVFINKVNNFSHTFGYNNLCRVILGNNGDNIPSGCLTGNLDDIYILNGICEYSNDNNFVPPRIKFVIPYESEEDYSGMLAHIQVNEDVKKYDLLYYEPRYRRYMKADASDEKKLPVRCIALEDGDLGARIKVLLYGTIAANSNDFETNDFEFNSILPIINNNTNSYKDVEITTSSFNPITTTLNTQNSINPYNLINGNKKLQRTKLDNFFSFNNPRNAPHKKLKIRLNEPKKVKYYRITSWNNSSLVCATNWKLKASNDNKNWELLDTRFKQSFSPNETKIFEIQNPIEAKYYEFFDAYLDVVSKIELLDEDKINIIPDFDFGFHIDSDSNEVYRDVFHLVDNLPNTYYSPTSGRLTCQIDFDFGYIYDSDFFDYVNIKKYSITSCYNIEGSKKIYVPSDFILEGSDNKEDWVELHSLIYKIPFDSPWTNYGEEIIFDLNSITHYRYYRLKINACLPIMSGALPTSLKIPSIKFYDENDINILPIGDDYIIPIFKDTNYDYSTLNPIVVTDNTTGLMNTNISKNFEKYNPKINRPIDVLLNTNNSLTYENSTRLNGWYISFADLTTTNGSSNTYTSCNAILQIDLGENNEQEICGLTILGRGTTSSFSTLANLYYDNPGTWTFKGSNDLTTWTNLYTSTATDTTTLTAAKATLKVTWASKGIKYRYYRLTVTKTVNAGNGVFIQKLLLFDENQKQLEFDNSYITGTKIYQNIPDNNLYLKSEHACNKILNDSPSTSGFPCSNILFNHWNFTTLDSYKGQWISQYSDDSDDYNQDIIIEFPDSKFEFYDHRINGYFMRIMNNAQFKESFRYPYTWEVFGWDGNSWILIDHKDQYIFDKSNSFEYFDLDQTYDNFSKIKLSILETSGSITIRPPNYIGLSNFYPTYNKQKIELPSQSSDIRYLNRTVHYNPNNPEFTWELEYSHAGRDILYHAHAVFRNNIEKYWTIPTSEAIFDTQYSTDKSSIHFALKSVKRLYGYGIYLAPLALCGKFKSIMSWRLFGSNDNINWDELDYINPITEEMARESWPLFFKINTNKSYRFYKFDDIEAGIIQGIEFYEKSSLKFNGKDTDTALLTPSFNNPGKITSIQDANVYEFKKTNKFIQNIGYTGLNFSTAEEEYSVNFFDFNTQITPTNPNQGNVEITQNTLIGHNIYNGPLVTYLCDSLKINSGCLLSTNINCRGLRIIVKGDCYIEGTLSMTNRGSSYFPFWKEDFPIITENGKILGYIPRYGANGADNIIYNYKSNTNNLDLLDIILNWTNTVKTSNTFKTGTTPHYIGPGLDGNFGINRQTGGGGSGSCGSGTLLQLMAGGQGGAGNCFSGGAGGGSYFSTISTGQNVIGCPAINDASLGGAAISASLCLSNTGVAFTNNSGLNIGCGAGNPLGNIFAEINGITSPIINKTPSTYDNSVIPYVSPIDIHSPGGLLILIVYGNLYINSLGKIEANGGNGDVTSITGCHYFTGGGSGGGSINIFHGGLFVNNGVIEANGGQPPAAICTKGGNGGNGCITIQPLL